jgi:hypothetical protein
MFGSGQVLQFANTEERQRFVVLPAIAGSYLIVEIFRKICRIPESVMTEKLDTRILPR